METTIIEGGCFCGEVRYQVTIPPAWAASVCHCYACRLTSGAPYLSGPAFLRDAFSFVKGEPVRYRYIRGHDDAGRAWGERTFCGRCGTQFTHTNNDDPEIARKWIGVTGCSLDDPEAFPPRHWTGGIGAKLSWVEVPCHETRTITPQNKKEKRKWREDLLPLISSRVAGQLGIFHLPRLWCKVLLGAQGRLHTDYPGDGDRFDRMVIDGLGLNVEETVNYLRENLPSYPSFERWILLKKGVRLDSETVEEVNAKIRGYIHDSETRKAILEFAGMEDDGSIRDAIALNDLEDWGEFHRILTSGHEVDTEKGIITGGCHCGRVRYRATTKPKASHICHCSNCRRASAAPFVAWLLFPSDRLSFLKGEPVRYRYTREDGSWAERAFCGHCGTQLTYQSEGKSGQIDVTTCSTDDSEAFPPTSHECIEEKLSWVELWPLNDSM